MEPQKFFAGARVLVAIVLSLLLHVVAAWGLTWGMSVALADKKTVDTLAQLDLSSVDLSFSEQDVESAPPQLAAATDSPVEEIPPPQPVIDLQEPPPMENLPEDPAAAVRLVPRHDAFNTALTLPDEIMPLEDIPPETPPEVSASSARPLPQPSEVSTPSTPAPQQAHVDAPPSPRRAIRPKYPEGARHRREEGTVTLELSVDAQGAVVDVVVVEPGRFAELRDAAVKAVRAARFKPATAGGKPVAAKARLTLNFRLKD